MNLNVREVLNHFEDFFLISFGILLWNFWILTQIPGMEGAIHPLNTMKYLSSDPLSIHTRIKRFFFLLHEMKEKIKISLS